MLPGCLLAICFGYLTTHRRKHVFEYKSLVQDFEGLELRDKIATARSSSEICEQGWNSCQVVGSSKVKCEDYHNSDGLAHNVSATGVHRTDCGVLLADGEHMDATSIRAGLLKDQSGSCAAMATRSRTSQQAHIEVQDAIKELTNTNLAASGTVSVAYAARTAAIAAAEALRTDHVHEKLQHRAETNVGVQLCAARVGWLKAESNS